MSLSGRKGICSSFLHSGKFVFFGRDQAVLIELFLSYGVGILRLWRQEDECLHVSVTGSDTSLNEINVLRSCSFVLLPLLVNRKEDQNLLSPFLICYTRQKSLVPSLSNVVEVRAANLLRKSYLFHVRGFIM
jgi:hypothetical protein